MTLLNSALGQFEQAALSDLLRAPDNDCFHCRSSRAGAEAGYTETGGKAGTVCGAGPPVRTK